MVDIEADGPYPGEFSRVSLGGVALSEIFGCQFHAEFAPLSAKYNEDYPQKCNVTRASHLTYLKPEIGISKFVSWVNASCKGLAVFLSDNLAFDWQFVNYYGCKFFGSNPFSYTGRRIGDSCSGLERDLPVSSDWKKERLSELPHDPLEDALLNAKAFIATLEKHKITLLGYHLR